MTKVVDVPGGWKIKCPGCKYGHIFQRGRWAFSNYDYDKPTFTPSLLIRVNDRKHRDYRPGISSTVCHSVVTDGRIRYLADSTHSLAGQTVDLPEIEK